MLMDSFDFPFSLVPKNSRIVIYGLGMVGKAYIQQIEETSHCRIVAVSDKNSMANNYGYDYIVPKNIPSIEFDCIIIANNSIISSAEIYKMLLELGIPQHQILCGYQSERNQENDDGKSQFEDKTRVSIRLCGGLGDYVVLLAFVRKLYDVDKNICIDLYGVKEHINAIYDEERYVHRCYSDEEIRYRLCDIYAQSDVLVQVDHFPQFFICNQKRLREKSPILAEYINQSINDVQIRDLQNKPLDFLSTYHRAHLFKQNRYQFLGQGDIWRIKTEDAALNVNAEYRVEYEKLKIGENYITFNYGASMQAGDTQTKVWPQEYYDQLIGSIKKEYPGIKVVQVGDRHAPKFKSADAHILEADLQVVKHVLFHSKLHVDGEGGLVHLATQLGTKCIVMFGPTPVEYYGYPQNINIVATECSNCCHVTPNWFTTCILGDEKPRCMYSIKPETVMKYIREYLG